MAAATKILAVVRAVIATKTVVDGRFRVCRVALAEVVEASGCPRRPVMRVLDRLVREGWLELVSNDRIHADNLGEVYGPARRNPTYQVIRDFRLHRGYQVRARVSCRDKIWSTLRTLLRSTPSNLERLTGCGNKAVAEFLRMLKDGGYVREVGKESHEKVWALTKDIGAKRPETPLPNRRRKKGDA